MVPFERVMVVSYRLSIATILSLTIRQQLAIECLWHSNQEGVGHFEAKPGQEGVDQCKSNIRQEISNYYPDPDPVKQSGRNIRLQNKLCRYLLPFEHNARRWQTDRQGRNGNIDRNIILDESLTSDVTKSTFHEYQYRIIWPEISLGNRPT